MQQGGQYRLLLSSVLGHTPNKTEAWIFGDKGTLAFITPNNAEPYLQLGKKGGAADWQQVVHGWWRSTLLPSVCGHGADIF